MTARRLPVRQGTDEWLAMRRTGISASDLPVITGNRPGLLSLWAEKSGLMDPEPPDEGLQELFDIGHALEPVIADIYSRKSGRPVRRVGHMLRHPDIEWAYASLDRVSAVRGERRIVELKYAAHRTWSDGPEPVPAAVQDQVQWQAFVTGYEVADVAVLTSGRVDIHEVPADAAYQADLRALAEWFRGLIATGTRPPVDGSEETRRTLTRLHPREDGTIRAPSSDIDDVARQLYRARADAKASADYQATLENTLRALLGDAPGVEGTGYRVTWTRNKDTAKTDWHAAFDDVADAYLGEHSRVAVIGDHTTTSEGPRVLRVTYREEAAAWL